MREKVEEWREKLLKVRGNKETDDVCKRLKDLKTPPPKVRH